MRASQFPFDENFILLARKEVSADGASKVTDRLQIVTGPSERCGEVFQARFRRVEQTAVGANKLRLLNENCFIVRA